MGLSNAERQRRYIARLKAKAGGGNADALKARCATLEGELARAKAKIDELMRERLAFRFGSKRTAKPKAEKPPLPPDEERERIIKGLKTRVRNLTAELHATRELNIKIALSNGMMNFQTMSAIAKALHPDRAPSETERAEACKLFTAWKADKDKAGRRPR